MFQQQQKKETGFIIFYYSNAHKHYNQFGNA